MKMQFWPRIEGGKLKIVGVPPQGLMCTDLKQKIELDGQIYYKVTALFSVRRRVPKYVYECRRLGLDLGKYAVTGVEMRQRVEESPNIILGTKVLRTTSYLLRLNEVACDIQLLVLVDDIFWDAPLRKIVLARINALMVDYLEPHRVAFETYLRKERLTAAAYWRAQRLAK